MSFSVGIIGLPNIGKSTLFKALTKKEVEIGPFPFTTIHPNYGKVIVPDSRLEKLARVLKPEKVSPTSIEFVDIAGLVKNAWQGAGLGNQFLAEIRGCSALVQVIRTFEDEKIEHVEKTLDPQRDLEIVRTELLMKDLETLEKVLTKLEKKRDKVELKYIVFLRELKERVSQGKAIVSISILSEFQKEVKELQLLTQKPIIYLLNTGAREISLPHPPTPCLKINLKLEEELSELSLKDRAELGMKSSLEDLILGCSRLLDLITFYTIVGLKELKAWTIPRGASALEAAGLIHSDFQARFIKAEVINWRDLIKSGSWKEAKEKGLIGLVGRDYLLQDGQVIEIKI